MWPDRVSNPGPRTDESGVLSTFLGMVGWCDGAGKLPVPGRPPNFGVSRVVRWRWVNVQCRRVLLI